MRRSVIPWYSARTSSSLWSSSSKVFSVFFISSISCDQTLSNSCSTMLSGSAKSCSAARLSNSSRLSRSRASESYSLCICVRTASVNFSTDSMPRRSANASSSMALTGSRTSLTSTSKTAVFPAMASAGYSAGKAAVTVTESPALAPVNCSSKPGINAPEPSSSSKFSAAPFSIGSPSICPTKSIRTISPLTTARGSLTGSKRFSCSTRRSRALSSSPSSIVTASRIRLSFVRSPGSISGSTSSSMVYSRSSPSANLVISILGCTAGRSSRSPMTSRELWLTWCSSTSPSTDDTYLLRISEGGTLPLRKPLISMVRLSSAMRSSISPWIAAAGTTTV